MSICPQLSKKKKNAFENTENRRVRYALIPAVYGVDGSSPSHVTSWRYKPVNCFNSNTERKFVHMRESARTRMKWNVKTSRAGTFMLAARDGAIRRPHFIVDLLQLSFISWKTQWNVKITQLITAMSQAWLYNKRFCFAEPWARSFLETIRNSYRRVGNTTTYRSV